MEQIDKLIAAWLDRWWPEPKPAESNVVKKSKKKVPQEMDDTPFRKPVAPLD